MSADEATWRSWAIPVYRALQAAGPDGLSRLELADRCEVSENRISDVTWWLRARGVAIEYRVVGPNDARYVLGSPMATAWDETVPRF